MKSAHVPLFPSLTIVQFSLSPNFSCSLVFPAIDPLNLKISREIFFLIIVFFLKCFAISNREFINHASDVMRLFLKPMEDSYVMFLNCFVFARTMFNKTTFDLNCGFQAILLSVRSLFSSETVCVHHQSF